MALRRRHGISLIELLIAMAIGFALMLMLWGSMRSSAKKFKAGESGLEAVLEGQRIMEYLRKDVSGPYPWTPCNYPEEELRRLKIATSKEGFAILPRWVDHWVDYYTNHKGPIAPKTRHRASVQRVLDNDAPCGVVWDPDLSRWRSTPPPKLKLQESLKTITHPIEFVPKGRTPRPDIWVIGPAFWVHDAEKRNLLRYTEEHGWVEFGRGRVEVVDMRPVMEESWNWVTVPPPPYEAISTHKELLAVRLLMARDEGRPPLELMQVLAKR